MGEVVSGNFLPWDIGDASRKHWQCRGRSLVLSAGGALATIVSYVFIYARPIHCFFHLSLHPIDPLMDTMEVSRGPVEQFWGMHTLVLLEVRPVLTEVHLRLTRSV